MLLTLEHLVQKPLSYLGVMAGFLAPSYKHAPCALSPQFRGLRFHLPGFAAGRARVMCERPPVLAGLRGPQGGQNRLWARGERGRGAPGRVFPQQRRELRFPARPRRTLRNSGARPGWDWLLRAAVPQCWWGRAPWRRCGGAGTGPVRQPCALGSLR